MNEFRTLGQRIRRHRIQEGLKMMDLAANAAVSKDALSSLENGRNVTPETLAQALKALGQSNALANLLPEPVMSPDEARKLMG